MLSSDNEMIYNLQFFALRGKQYKAVTLESKLILMVVRRLMVKNFEKCETELIVLVQVMSTMLMFDRSR